MDIETNEDDLFFVINFHMLELLINQICVCCSYNGQNLEICNTDKKRFSLQFSIDCNDCEWSYKFFSSPEFRFQEKDSKGRKSYEVNIRSVIGSREIGR